MTTLIKSLTKSRKKTVIKNSKTKQLTTKRAYISITIALLLIMLVGAYLKYLVSQSVRVTIDDSGFHPSVITINQGTKVTWVNKGKSPHWPASDPHPQHTDYPNRGGCIGSTLDACRPLATGENFSFNFKDSGKWGMHDHLYPSNYMVVVVRTGNVLSRIFRTAQIPPVVAVPTPASFRALSNVDQQRQLQTLARVDPKQAWIYLKQVYGGEGSVGSTHQYAHMIGGSLFKVLGDEGVSICDASFGFGCYHGFAEEGIKELGIGGAQRVATACEAQSGQAAGNCIHGLGHAFVSYRQYSIKPALDDCNALGVQWASSCQNGAFMEYSDGVALSKLPDKSNLWQVCDNLERKYDYNCGFYIANIAKYRFKLTNSETADICQKGRYETAVSRCVSAFGAYALNDSTSVTAVESACTKNFSSQWRVQCVTEAAYSTVFRRLAGWEENSLTLCDTLTATDQNECLRRRKEVINI